MPHRQMTRAAVAVTRISPKSTPPHAESPSGVIPEHWPKRAPALMSWPNYFGSYPDSSERLNDLTVRDRSLLANSAATGFINRINPKSSPSAV